MADFEDFCERCEANPEQASEIRKEARIEIYKLKDRAENPLPIFNAGALIGECNKCYLMRYQGK